MKYGIISAGKIAHRAIGAINAARGKIVAIAARSGEKASEMAQKYQIPVSYGNYEDLYRDDNIDIVYIANYTGGHVSETRKALNAGKHVVCEKPMSLRITEAEELFDLAARKNLFLMEAQKSVFLPVTVEVKNIIASGEIGQVRRIELSSAHFFGKLDGDWLYEAGMGGGCLYGDGGYMLAYPSFVMGECPSEVKILADYFSQGAVEQCVLFYRLGPETMVSASTSYAVRMRDEVIYWGTKGNIRIPDYWKANSATVTYYDGRPLRELAYPSTWELEYEFRHVEQCLQEGLLQSPILDKRFTCGIIRLVETLHARNRH